MRGKPSTNSRSRREIALGAVGMTVGQRWTLLGVIGSGGTATVYEAVHRNGSRVAVKILHAEFIVHERIRRRFLAEGYAANLVGHEGAVKVLDDGQTEDGGAYLVMELLQGETLAARLARNGALPSNQVLEWGLGVLEVLAAAHEHQVVHRDVKPSNIFLTDRGQLKLLDFGIARVLADSTDDEAFATQQGVALGTPAFMAPEQATGNLEEIGAATDVWGVGATLFQLLSGRPIQEPRSDAGPSSELIAAAPPVRAFAPSVPAEFARVVDRALNLRPSARWPSARAMIRALELARDAPLAPTPSGADTLTEEGVIVPKAALIARPHVAVAALAFLATLAGGLHWLRKMQPAASNHPVATAGVARALEAPAARATAEPPIAPADSTAPSASPQQVRAPDKQLHAPAMPARHKQSGLTPPAAPSASPTAAKVEASSLDSMLDRRK